MFGNKKLMGFVSLLVIAATVLSACAAPAPVVVEKEVPVEREVVKEVVVEKEVPVVVEKEVVVEKPVVQTVIVEKEVVVEKPVVETVVVEKQVEVVVTATPETVARGGDLVIGVLADKEPASMDAHVDPFFLARLTNSFVADPLILLTTEGEYKPLLATSWTLSPDGTTWTFALRKDVKFQDGTPFNAGAVKFNIDRVMDPETQSALMADYLGVKEYSAAEVVDEFTVKVIYNAQVPTVLWGLSQFPVWSPTAVEEYDKRFHENLVGIGAFRMDEWVRGSHVKLVKDPNYNGGSPLQEHTGPAYLDSLTFRFVGEEAILGEVLKTGEVNMVMELPAQFADTYRDDPGFQVVDGYQPSTGIQFVMNQDHQPLADIRVRQALSHAYDQDKLNETLFDGNWIAIKGPLSRVTKCYWQGAEDVYPYDPEIAESLLEEAGWEVNPTTGIREKDGKPLSLTLVLVGGHRAPIAEYLGAHLRNIGVELNTEIVPGPVQFERALNGDFDLIYERLRSFEPDVLFTMWYSKNLKPGGWSWSRFQNDEFDEILLKTQSTADPDERCELFVEAQKMITENALALPIINSAIIYGMDKDVKGFRLGVLGTNFFVNDMYIEK